MPRFHPYQMLIVCCKNVLSWVHTRINWVGNAVQLTQLVTGTDSNDFLLIEMQPPMHQPFIGLNAHPCNRGQLRRLFTFSYRL